MEILWGVHVVRQAQSYPPSTEAATNHSLGLATRFGGAPYVAKVVLKKCFLWVIPQLTFYLTLYLTIYLTFCLTFYLTYILTFYLAFYFLVSVRVHACPAASGARDELLALASGTADKHDELAKVQKRRRRAAKKERRRRRRRRQMSCTSIVKI